MMDKHLQHEGQQRTRMLGAQWPPKNSTFTQSPSLFYRVSDEHGMKKVAWPPRSPSRSIEVNGDNEIDMEDNAHYHVNRVSGQTPPPPSGVVTLREKPPVKQSPVPTFASQPFLRSCTPTRKTGDMVWPPKKSGSGQNDYRQSPMIDTKPKRQPPKDYKPLFSRHQIPSSCPVTYRMPPVMYRTDVD